MPYEYVYANVKLKQYVNYNIKLKIKCFNLKYNIINYKFSRMVQSLRQMPNSVVTNPV